jgi:hypothetical protein
MKTENWINKRDSFHFSSIYVWVCECEFHKSKQTQFEKIERLRRERIQDVDWDLCSNTFSSIVQVSLHIDEESLVSILHLCIACVVCVVSIESQSSTISRKRMSELQINQSTQLWDVRISKRECICVCVCVCVWMDKTLISLSQQTHNTQHTSEERPDSHCNINNIFIFVRFTLCNNFIH